MYNTPVPVTAAGSTLAYTGSNSLWWALAAFALIAAGFALLRILPKPSTPESDFDLVNGDGFAVNSDTDHSNDG